MSVADGRRRGLAAVLLGGEHLDQLATACHQRTQRLGRRIWQWSHRGTHRIGEVGQHLGVDGVSLGQLADRFGEVAHLARVDSHDR